MTKREYAEAIAKELDMEIKECEKANGVIRIGVTPKTPTGQIAPVIYIDEAYDNDYTVEEGIDMVNAMMENSKEQTVDMEAVTKFENIKDKVKARLYNKKTNADVYRSAEEYGYNDLIIVPYIDNIIEGGSIKITEALCALWGVEPSEVIDYAMENTSYKLTTMEELFPMPLPGGDAMHIVTNDNMAFGAIGVILAAKELEEMFPDGYIVLPSSIHECIVVEDTPDFREMGYMVREINASMVAPEEQLSDNVYTFVA